MLRGLRIQLLLLSLVAAVGLVALLGGGSYYLLKLYMQRSTDLTLQAKMASQFRQYGLSLPPELANAEKDWLGSQKTPDPVSQFVVQAATRTMPPLKPIPTLLDTPLPSPTSTDIALLAIVTPTSPFPNPTNGTGASAGTTVQTQPSTNRQSSGSLSNESDSEENASQSDDNGESTSKSKTPSTSAQTATNRSNVNSAPASKSSESNASSDSANANESDSPAAGATIPTQSTNPETETFDDRLNSVFVIPLDTSGQVIQNSSQAVNNPVILDRQASANALAIGYDLRTIRLEDGNRARLLTYRTAVSGGPELLQVGRLLNEQDQVLRWFLTGLVVLTAIAAFLLGAGSWWLTGRALNPAQQAWENQQTFIANASHELRAPLTLVKANAEVGLRLAPPPEQKEILAEILHESDYMNHLVEDLLLLSRLDTRRLKLERIKIDTKDLLEEIQNHMSLIAAEKQIAIQLGETSGKIWGDPVHVRQVLLILIDNSLRFTHPGGRILLESRPSGRMVQIGVSDNGAGIPPADLPHVFERFYQATQTQKEDNENPRGNGLGLSIARALIEAQEGEIQIVSTLGKGTEVKIQLPASE